MPRVMISATPVQKVSVPCELAVICAAPCTQFRFAKSGCESRPGVNRVQLDVTPACARL